MQRHENRLHDRPGLTVPLGLSVTLLLLFSMLSQSHARSQARRKHSANAPATEQQTQTVARDGGTDAAYIFVKGEGILRLQDGAAAPVLATPAALRDLQIDREGALWASLRGVGVVRNLGGRNVTLNPDSFAKLAIRSPTDVWTINDLSLIHI